MSFSQPIQLPEVRKLSDLLVLHADKAAAVPGKFRFVDYGWSKIRGRWEKDEVIDVGPFVGFTVRRRGGNGGHHLGRGSAYATPTELVVKAVCGSMIAAGVNDQITFEIVDRGDELLVVAKNSVIIGSRWIALLPASERKHLVPFLYQ